MKNELLDLYEEYLRELTLMRDLVSRVNSEEDLHKIMETALNSARFLVSDIVCIK
jgi:hypothetical protein